MKQLLRPFLSFAARRTDLSAADPWQHPALARMSLRELADLPFPRAADITGAEGLPCRLAHADTGQTDDPGHRQ
jgi:hypothetical protein